MQEDKSKISIINMSFMLYIIISIFIDSFNLIFKLNSGSSIPNFSYIVINFFSSFGEANIEFNVVKVKSLSGKVFFEDIISLILESFSNIKYLLLFYFQNYKINIIKIINKSHSSYYIILIK